MIHAVEIDVFNEKCAAYIEGYHYVPEGQTWIYDNSAEFHGLMIALTEDYGLLEVALLQLGLI